mmetsp:Transcript_15488/g.29965  ORF Transcript_15488/g.29965 Transcript_15488/m.29965 type:complete len:148 (+) Transcript_15488:341-784(+)
MVPLHCIELPSYNIQHHLAHAHVSCLRLWHFFFLLMHVLPHGCPVLQCLQHSFGGIAINAAAGKPSLCSQLAPTAASLPVWLPVTSKHDIAAIITKTAQSERTAHRRRNIGNCGRATASASASASAVAAAFGASSGAIGNVVAGPAS